jgi:argininosuccinate synthase
MDAMRALLNETQKYVKGTVKLELYKGNITCIGRESEYSLYDEKLVSMEDDEGAYDQQDAAGFIKLHSLPLRANTNRLKK